MSELDRIAAELKEVHGIERETTEKAFQTLSLWFVNAEAYGQRDRAILDALTEVCPACEGDDSGGGFDEPPSAMASCTNCVGGRVAKHPSQETYTREQLLGDEAVEGAAGEWPAAHVPGLVDPRATQAEILDAHQVNLDAARDVVRGALDALDKGKGGKDD